MKLAVVGSRIFDDSFYDEVKDKLDFIIAKYHVNVIVSGGAKGIDTLADKYANEMRLSKIIFPAQWQVYGRSAGVIRNKEIVDYCDLLVAFWDGKSSGTKNSIDLAKEQDKLLKVYILKGKFNHAPIRMEI